MEIYTGSFVLRLVRDCKLATLPHVTKICVLSVGKGSKEGSFQEVFGVQWSS